MYLSEKLLRAVFSKISSIGPDTGKARLERVSAISRFFAGAEQMHGSSKSELDLAPNTKDRADYIASVGRVIGLGSDGEYTPDFIHRDAKKDYAVGNNFLTTQVSASKNTPSDYPKRPAPLLFLEDQKLRLHREFAKNLSEKYGWDKVRSAFAIWLCRTDEFPSTNDNNAVVREVNLLMNRRFAPDVANMLILNEQDASELFSTITPWLQDQIVDVSSFGQPHDKSGQGESATALKHGTPGKNQLYYGAPGTGKSHKVDGIAGKVNTTRTVFHPDTQNSDFFGALKPRMKNGKIEYGFAPGPFCIALRNALLRPDEHHYLVIEELNRAPAAAVFGELFQLLDRVPDTGESSYEIAFPSMESAAWFSEEHIDLEKLSIPGNLTILATMNSSDQGVYALDTAFRRRWDQEYLPLYGNACPEGVVRIASQTGELSIPWRIFVREVNDFLIATYDIPEDRLLGQWFVKSHELNAPVPDKILLYLWDDLLRHEERGLLFNGSAGKTYGQVHEAQKKKRPVFHADFLERLKMKAENGTDSPQTV